ncbi:hypothetical protein [Gordonia soli]|nr:hypothetical protein [Gordonia soli]
MSRLPRPGWPDEFTEDEIAAAHFIQAAGSADRMTVEIRKPVEDQSDRLFTIGHPPAHCTTEPPAEVIRFGEHTTPVYPNEIFVADKAAELFFHYYKNDDIPDGYVLRELHFPEYENA